MTANAENPRRHMPATLRNREAILAVLKGVVPQHGLLLEIASGSGEHAAFMAPQLMPLVWQPSDYEAENLPSIDAHAADSGAALPLLKDRLLDLLICDLHLGEINGQSLIRAVRLNPNFTNRYMPIIVLTGDSKAETVRELIDLGINKFLSKPATAESLIEAVRSVLERPKAFVTSKDYFGPDRRNRQEPGAAARRSTDQAPEDAPLSLPKRTDVKWT